jgi:hypothetical protein
MTTSGETTTFCPMLQRAPIADPLITWQKCQIFVPAPIEQFSSTNDDGWTKYDDISGFP